MIVSAFGSSSNQVIQWVTLHRYGRFISTVSGKVLVKDSIAKRSSRTKLTSKTVLPCSHAFQQSLTCDKGTMKRKVKYHVPNWTDVLLKRGVCSCSEEPMLQSLGHMTLASMCLTPLRAPTPRLSYLYRHPAPRQLTARKLWVGKAAIITISSRATLIFRVSL